MLPSPLKTPFCSTSDTDGTDTTIYWRTRSPLSLNSHAAGSKVKFILEVVGGPDRMKKLSCAVDMDRFLLKFKQSNTRSKSFRLPIQDGFNVHVALHVIESSPKQDVEKETTNAAVVQQLATPPPESNQLSPAETMLLSPQASEVIVIPSVVELCQSPEIVMPPPPMDLDFSQPVVISAAPPSNPKPDNIETSQDRSYWEQKLTALFETACPKKIRSIEKILNENVGNEAHIFKKYVSYFQRTQRAASEPPNSARRRSASTWHFHSHTLCTCIACKDAKQFINPSEIKVRVAPQIDDPQADIKVQKKVNAMDMLPRSQHARESIIDLEKPPRKRAESCSTTLRQIPMPHMYTTQQRYYKTKLVELFLEHDPGALLYIDDIMTFYKGRETEMMQNYEEKLKRATVAERITMTHFSSIVNAGSRKTIKTYKPVTSTRPQTKATIRLPPNTPPTSETVDHPKASSPK
eukprot:PhF_6_TR20012/c1_g1_i1/m.29224